MEGLLSRIGQEIGLLVVVGLAVLLLAIPLFVWRRRHMSTTAAAWKTALEGVIAGSLALAVRLTLGGFDGGGPQLNLVPFQSIVETMALGEFWVELAVADIVGNLVLFSPLGFAVALRFPRMKFLVWVLASVALTVAIESAQLLVLNRSADITDVITNASGAIAGFTLGRAVLRASRRRASAEAST